MRVLLTGATGLLGRYMLNSTDPRDEVWGVSRRGGAPGSLNDSTHVPLDITDVRQTLELLTSVDPDVVIHAAAEGSVDAIQGNMESFRTLNVRTPSLLANWCESHSRKLVFISSNAVYGGRAEPYGDESDVSPVNDYGRLKVEAELQVREANPSTLIIRPILMYGWPNIGRRGNPVTDWISKLRAGQEVCVVEDVETQPLYAGDAAIGVWRAVRSNLTGTMNFGGGQPVSLFDFARLTARAFDLNDALIQPIKSQDLPDLAPRPKQTRFDNRRLQEQLNVTVKSPAEGLSCMRSEEEQLNAGHE